MEQKKHIDNNNKQIKKLYCNRFNKMKKKKILRARFPLETSEEEIFLSDVCIERECVCM